MRDAQSTTMGSVSYREAETLTEVSVRGTLWTEVKGSVDKARRGKEKKEEKIKEKEVG